MTSRAKDLEEYVKAHLSKSTNPLTSSLVTSIPPKWSHDFALDGIPADWMAGHPRIWGDENDKFSLPKNYLGGGAENEYITLYSAISSDGKLLAVSTSNDRIAVFDIASKELRQELEGTGEIVFRPNTRPIENIYLTEGVSEDTDGKPAYTLVGSLPSDARRKCSNTLVLYELDKRGRVLVEEEFIDASEFATKAIHAIAPELAIHEWTESFIASTSLHKDFTDALHKAARAHRNHHHASIEDAELGKFGSNSFNSDGTKMLYHASNRSPSRGRSLLQPINHEYLGMLPHVVVWDFTTGVEVFKLQGHTDSIRWSSFSPDDTKIATVSWDGTLRMYDAQEGSLLWATENSGGQSWSGAFSPDSQSIIWSSANGRTVKVHSVPDGKLTAVLTEELQNWCRCMAWHPDGKQVALVINRMVSVWRPFDGSNGTITQRFELKDYQGWRHFPSISSAAWLADGQKLAVCSTDGTTLVWDSQTNGKELFKKPKVARAAFSTRGFHFCKGDSDKKSYYLSVDGDGNVRLWQPHLSWLPGWWETAKKASKTKEVKGEYPETGKYVKVSRLAKPTESTNDTQRNVWAERGAELWTAE